MSGDSSRRPGSIDPGEWEIVKELVFACMSVDAALQQQWLAEHCPNDRVRREVERLLAASHGDGPSFLDVPAAERLLDRRAPERIGHFRIESELGIGGMGVVYAAVDERLGRQVAIKVLQPGAELDEARRRRLLWDAQAASALNHPNIVCVYETGEADGVDYVAMELVAGGTLADLLAAGPLPLPKVLSLATQIASALETAHAQGIVHRDLKPSNVMIAPTGTAKLVDFGLAKHVGNTLPAAAAPPTIEGQLAGTVAYMSPEQAEGLETDARSDIFSFGSVLYEMLTGERAFSGASAVSVLARVIHADPPLSGGIARTIDPRLDEVVRRCLRKDRERRFQSMAEVRVRLQEIADEPLVAAAAPARAGIGRWTIGLLVTGAALAAALATAAVLRWQQQPAAVALARLTWDGGLTTAPSISRDGTLLAYASDRSGRGDLDVWVQKMGGSDPIRLTTDAADDSDPAISPDGMKVAFRSERDGGGVYLVSSLGGNERLLAPRCRDPRFSPDSQTIACWSGDTGGSLRRGSAKVWLVSATGGPPRQFRPELEAAAMPLWLAGDRLMFLGRQAARGADAPAVDWLAAAETGDVAATGALDTFKRQGLSAAADGFFIRPEAWVERASSILFTARHEDATNLWAVDAAADGTLRGDARRVTSGAAVEARPAVAADARGIVFANLSIESRLRRLALGADGTANESAPLLPTLSQIASPSVSADGRLLVFSARQRNGYRVIAVDPATANERLVTTVESPDFVRVILSGNGSWIVYVGAANAAYRMAVSNGVPEAICPDCGWPTHVSYDGREALFESRTANERLQIWSGGRVRPLTGGGGSRDLLQFSGRFSPDARFVVLCAGPRESRSREIFVIPNTRGGPVNDDDWVRVSEHSTSDREPYWSTDGRRIFYISERDGFRCIWARPMDPATGRPSGPSYPVAHFHHARELLRSPVPSWGAIGLSASAQSLVFTVAESSGNLWWRHETETR